MKDPDNPDEYVQRAEIVSHFWIPRADRQGQAVSGDSGEAGETLDGQYNNTQVHNADPRSYVGGLVGVGQHRNLGAFGEERDLDGYEMPGYAR